MKGCKTNQRQSEHLSVLDVLGLMMGLGFRMSIIYLHKGYAFNAQVYVVEPSVEDTITILQGLERYGHHGVRILDMALVVAAQLSA
jgi:hypothetical protein